MLDARRELPPPHDSARPAVERYLRTVMKKRNMSFRSATFTALPARPSARRPQCRSAYPPPSSAPRHPRLARAAAVATAPASPPAPPLWSSRTADPAAHDQTIAVPAGRPPALRLRSQQDRQHAHATSPHRARAADRTPARTQGLKGPTKPPALRAHAEPSAARPRDAKAIAITLSHPARRARPLVPPYRSDAMTPSHSHRTSTQP